MISSIQRFIACVVMTGAIASFSPRNATAQPTNPPTFLLHPQDQVIKLKKKAVFKAEAENPGPPSNLQLKYQWERRGPWATNFSEIVGATNKTFSIAKVSTNDVAYYRLRTSSINGIAYSEPAQLLVWTKHSPLTLYGSPIVTSGSSGTCPGSYVAYVNYKKSAAEGWGWAPDHDFGGSTHSAADNNFTDTNVQPQGITDDLFCLQTIVSNTHAGNPAPEDTKYRFTIYFTVSHSSPNPYPLTLNGFKP